LHCAFEERHGVHLSDPTIWTWVAEEGFVWKRQQSWFREAQKHEAQFVEKGHHRCLPEDSPAHTDEMGPPAVTTYPGGSLTAD
jgi:hypothetical protein